jgi:diacylglycerol O-acyltransferase
MVDGIAGTDLLATLLDHSPQTRLPPTTPDDWHPDALPGPVRLLASATAAVPRRALTAARAVVATSGHARSGVTALAVDLHGMVDFARTLRVAPASSLSGALGASRVWADASASLDDVKKIKNVFGGTVNDVVLAAVTRGFRDLILERGEDLPRRGIVTLVPASVRNDATDGQPGNQISAMLAALPVQIADPHERFTAVRGELDRLKRSGEAQAGQLLTRAAALVPPVIATVGLTLGIRLPQRVVLTVATNVPGPRGPLFLAGRRLRELYPYVPIADHVRIAVAITSYDDRLYFGVTADRDSSPDIAVLTAGIEDGIQELIRALDDAA